MPRLGQLTRCYIMDLSREHEVELFHLAQGPHQDQRARHELLAHHEERISHLVRRHLGRRYGVNSIRLRYGDLRKECFQAGALAFLQALPAFSPDHGFRLWTYVRHDIAGAISETLNDRDAEEGPHTSLQTDLYDFSDDAANDRPVTVGETVGEEDAKRRLGWSTSFDSQWTHLVHGEAWDVVNALVARLNPRSQTILKLRFGLGESWTDFTDADRNEIRSLAPTRNSWTGRSVTLKPSRTRTRITKRLKALLGVDAKGKPVLMPLHEVARRCGISPAMAFKIEQRALDTLRRVVKTRGYRATAFLTAHREPYIDATKADIQRLREKGDGYARSELERGHALPMLYRQYPELLNEVFAWK